MNQKAKLADFDARERIAKEYGVDIEQVKTVGATNTMDVSDAPDPTGFAQKPSSSQPLDQIPDDHLQAIKNKQAATANERAKMETEAERAEIQTSGSGQRPYHHLAGAVAGLSEKNRLYHGGAADRTAPSGAFLPAVWGLPQSRPKILYQV